jgi:hypothetical protein
MSALDSKVFNVNVLGHLHTTTEHDAVKQAALSRLKGWRENGSKREPGPAA